MATQMPPVAQFSLPTPSSQPQNNPVAPTTTIKGMPPVAQFQLPQSNSSSTSQPQDLGLLGQALSGPIGQGIANVAKSIETPFISAAAKPVQYLAKSMGQPDPYASGVPTVAGNVVPSSPTLEHTVGDVAQVGSYFVPGSGVLGAAGMGVLQGAGNAMSQGQDLTNVVTQGAEGTALGVGGAAGAKLGGGLISKVGDLVSGDASTKALQGIKDAYSSALNLNAGERAFESRTGKDLSQVLMDNSAPLGKNEDGTLDATKALDILKNKQAPLDTEAQSILQNAGKGATVNLLDVANNAKSTFASQSMPALDKAASASKVDNYIQAEIADRQNTIAQSTYGQDFEKLSPQQQSKVYYDAINPSAEDADKIKTGFWNSVGKGFDRDTQLSENASYQLGKSTKTAIESAVPDSQLAQVNKERGDLIDAQRRLTKLDGVRVLKGGRLGNMAGGVKGAIVGMASGAGLPGALAGDYFGTKATEFMNNPATKLGIAQGKAKAAGLIPGLLGNVAQPIGQGISKTGSALSKSARLAGLLGNVLTK